VQRDGQWPHRSAISIAVALALVLFPLGGCRSAKQAASAAVEHPAPVAVEQEIRSNFLHGNLDRARLEAQKARQEASGHQDWAMKFRLLEAEILIYQGRRPEVVSLLTDPAVSYPTSGDLAIKRNLLLSLAHSRLGQADQADEELKQARSLAESTHSVLMGEVLRTAAVIEVSRDHLPEAAELSKESLKAATEQHDAFLEASNQLNLGLIAINLEHFDEALSLLNQAATTAKRAQAQMVTEAALGNLGRAYFDLGDYEKALANFQQAEQEAKRIGTTSAQVDWLWSSGSAYFQLGDLAAATKCYEESLQEAINLHSPAEIAGIQTELAFLLYEQRQYDAAGKHTDEALRAARSLGDKEGELKPLFLRALLATEQPDAPAAEKMLNDVYRQAAVSPSLRWEVEHALAHFYAETKRPQLADVWYRKAILHFEAQRSALTEEDLKLPFFANGNSLYRNYAEFLISTQKPDAALRILDAGRARTLEDGLNQTDKVAGARNDRALDAESVARKLESVLLFYCLGPDRSWLWVVAPHHTQVFPLPAQATIQAQVQNYHGAILKSSDPLREENAAAQMLYDTLVEPAAAMIPKGTRVVVIPDGALNRLNFETLLAPGASGPASARFHYWIEDVTVSSANSIRMLSHVDPSDAHRDDKKLLLIGNPVSAGTGYDTLINAFAEIRGIEKHFPVDDRTVVTQSEAVPGVYAADSPDAFSYIHFVAHGTASRLDPLDSAIVLSPSPQNPDHFKLYAREIMRCPLHARLVTISSCYGSGLRAYAGEGLVGLSWAFLRAGAHNVVGALWEVNDASTPLLMDRMYGEIQTGAAPDVALRTAKLSLIHSQAVYRKPLYWGAFQLYSGS
jgi:CHAT domain-containing protein/predicted negative regulator of RcsB-dependent stress response